MYPGTLTHDGENGGCTGRERRLWYCTYMESYSIVSVVRALDYND